MDGDLDKVYSNVKVILMEIEEKKAAKKEVSEAQERKNEVENSLVMGKSSSTVEFIKSRKLKTMNLDGSTAELGGKTYASNTRTRFV